MHKVLLDYLGEKVAEDLRRGVVFGDELTMELCEFPQVDHIRRNLRVDDLDAILRMANATSDATRRFALSLSRIAANDSRVKAICLTAWREFSDMPTKWAAMWRLLDDPNLDIELHNEFYAFVLSRWESWIDEQLMWFGSPAAVLPGVEKRLSDPAFPDTKAWAYLCSSMAAPDKDAVKRLLENYQHSPASIVARVAADMLLRLADGRGPNGS